MRMHRSGMGAQVPRTPNSGASANGCACCETRLNRQAFFPVLHRRQPRPPSVNPGRLHSRPLRLSQRRRKPRHPLLKQQPCRRNRHQRFRSRRQAICPSPHPIRWCSGMRKRSLIRRFMMPSSKRRFLRGSKAHSSSWSRHRQFMSRFSVPPPLPPQSLWLSPSAKNQDLPQRSLWTWHRRLPSRIWA